MQTQLASRLHLPWRSHDGAAPANGDAAPAAPPDELRRAIPILAAWLAFYAIAVIGCLYADRQRATEQATTATAAAETAGSR